MNKSKFLKKSLAMLLALMLVVAMIPLSASAALPDDLEFIYVDGNQVYVEDGEETTVEVNNNVDGKPATQVAIRTNEDLEDHDYELRAVQVDSEHELDLSNVNTTVYFDDYLSDDGKITLRLYDISKKTPEVRATYTLDIELVEANTTTNIASIEKGNGVYSVEWDNEEKVVNVVLARYTDCADGYPKGDEWDQDMQNGYEAEMTITPADEAKMGNTKVSANNGATFTITSQSGGNSSTYKVVATYLDALNSFSVTGTDEVEYFGEFTDENKDGVDDTITVVLPNSAIYNKWDEEITSPELVVKYAPKGNVTALNTVVNGEGVRSGATVKFENLGNKEVEKVEGHIDVYRLPAQDVGVLQRYDLIVKLQPSNNTDITYAQVNNTEAVVDLDAKTIVAEVPSADKIGGTDGADVIIHTDANARGVVIDSRPMTGGDGKWTQENVNLTTPKTVTVTAEDGTIKQYTLTVNKVTNETDARINAFWVKDTEGNTYKAEVGEEEDDLIITVPYMTTTVDNWKLYVTPASYTYVATAKKTDGKLPNTAVVPGDQLLNNGQETLGKVLDEPRSVIPVNGEITATLVAVNKNNTNMTKDYTVHFVLGPKDDGNTLITLGFTAQPKSEEASNKWTYRALTDENTFDNEVYVDVKEDHNVGTLNLQVPLGLYGTDDLGITYQNVITEYVTRDNGVAFISTEGDFFEPIDALYDDTDNDKLVADLLKDGGEVLVLPQEVARWAMLNQKGWDGNTVGRINKNHKYDGKPNEYAKNSSENLANKDGKAITEYGTLYAVKITAIDPASSESKLVSLSLGDFDFTIDGYTIKGEMPFSLTTDKVTAGDATFVEFEVSDYARLVNENSKYSDVAFFSNGDWDGYGKEDPINDIKTTEGEGNEYVGHNNWKLAFERNKDHTVTVYRCNDPSTGNWFSPITDLTVLAENRLDESIDKASSSKYTFQLTWQAPCEEADIKTFELGGYTGKISNDSQKGRTIEVSVPYGTDVTGMVAEFTTSTQAKVYMDDVKYGLSFESGVTAANYSDPIELYVVSEDEDTINKYVVTVTEGYTFEDIDEDDWFYDDVVAAAEEGYINGMEPGKYEPLGKLTRAQFATMIARAMNYDSNPDVEASFPDVKDDHYAKAAINFCYENDIIRGYEDGTFKPDKTISRQEVAAILARAFNLEEISSKAYPDDSQIAGWASDDVYKCLAAELMMGDADTGNFRPVSDLTRAEAATILMNANRAGFID